MSPLNDRERPLGPSRNKINLACRKICNVTGIGAKPVTLLSLLSGELDWAGLFVGDVENVFVAKDRAHNHHWFPLVGNPVVLYANTTRKPLGDPRVRGQLNPASRRGPRI